MQDETIGERQPEGEGERRQVKMRVGPVVVPKLGSANVRVICEHGPVLLSKIVLPRDVGEKFFVTDFKVGRNSQFFSCGAIPACVFTEEFDDGRALVADRLPRGQAFTISVTNRTPGEVVFEGELEGEVEVVLGEFEKRERKTFLGLGMTVLFPGMTHLTIQAQVPIVLDSFVLSPEALDGIRVLDLRVAGQSVLPAGGLRAGRNEISSVLARVQDWVVVEVEADAQVASGPGFRVRASDLPVASGPGFWGRVFNLFGRRSAPHFGDREKVFQAIALTQVPRVFTGALVGRLCEQSSELGG